MPIISLCLYKLSLIAKIIYTKLTELDYYQKSYHYESTII